jgi:NAD(P)H-flavin reductase
MIDLAIKGSEHPVTSWISNIVKEGNLIEVDGGYGSFYFIQNGPLFQDARHIFLIAGGVGGMILLGSIE